MSKRTAAIKKEGFSLLLPVLLSLGTGIVLILFQFALLCSIMCKTDLSVSLLGPLSTTAVCIAVLLSGMLLAFLIKKRGMLMGFALGAAFFAAILMAALLQGTVQFSALAFLKLIALCASGGIGGYFGILLAERKRRKH